MWYISITQYEQKRMHQYQKHGGHTMISDVKTGSCLARDSGQEVDELMSKSLNLEDETKRL